MKTCILLFAKKKLVTDFTDLVRFRQIYNNNTFTAYLRYSDVYFKIYKAQSSHDESQYPVEQFRYCHSTLGAHIPGFFGIAIVFPLMPLPSSDGSL